MSDKIDPTTTAGQIATLLTSGLAGRKLLDALKAQFPHAKRQDVFLGVTLAITLYEADYTIQEFELETAKADKPA